jgi:hypothetical protein
LLEPQALSRWIVFQDADEGTVSVFAVIGMGCKIETPDAVPTLIHAPTVAGDYPGLAKQFFQIPDHPAVASDLACRGRSTLKEESTVLGCHELDATEELVEMSARLRVLTPSRVLAVGARRHCNVEFGVLFQHPICDSFARRGHLRTTQAVWPHAYRTDSPIVRTELEGDRVANFWAVVSGNLGVVKEDSATAKATAVLGLYFYKAIDAHE